MIDRPDLYLGVHKGLRHAMNVALIRLGSADPSDPADIGEALGQLRELLAWMEEHLDVEERFVHAAVQARRPGALVAQLRHDHDGHARAFALLRADADALERAAEGEPSVARARSRHLYLAFSRFVGENLEHMATEEIDMNALLDELFTPEEIAGLFATIIASESLEQLGRSVRWVIPALDPDMRAAVIGAASAGIPAPVMDQLLAGIRAVLSPRDVAKLESALGIARVA